MVKGETPRKIALVVGKWRARVNPEGKDRVWHVYAIDVPVVRGLKRRIVGCVFFVGDFFRDADGHAARGRPLCGRTVGWPARTFAPPLCHIDETRHVACENELA